MVSLNSKNYVRIAGKLKVFPLLGEVGKCIYCVRGARADFIEQEVSDVIVTTIGSICGRIIEAEDLPGAQANIAEQEKRKAGFAKGGPPQYKDPAGNPRSN